jgi:hypothetical protein
MSPPANLSLFLATVNEPATHEVIIIHWMPVITLLWMNLN